jgi:hypothetical protein
VIEHPHVHQCQRRLQRLRQELVGTARLGRTRGMVVRQDHRRGIHCQRFLDHLARIHRGLRDRAAEHLLQRDDAMLCIEEQHAEHLVLQHPDLQPQMVLHRLRRRHRGTAPHPLRQHTPRLRQHLLGTRRAVLAIDIAHQQCISDNGRSRRQRHGELRSVSGGIARDRSTTPQRSRQGSKTAAGRKRSPRERADLDGETDVVAWVDTASPPPQTTKP